MKLEGAGKRSKDKDDGKDYSIPSAQGQIKYIKGLHLRKKVKKKPIFPGGKLKQLQYHNVRK